MVRNIYIYISVWSLNILIITNYLGEKSLVILVTFQIALALKKVSESRKRLIQEDEKKLIRLIAKLRELALGS